MSTATARVPSVSPDSSPMAASMSAGFLTTPAPRTRPAGDSHSTSGAPPVRGLCIKGAEDRPLASALSCLVGEIVLPEGTERGQGESGSRAVLSLTCALHVLPEGGWRAQEVPLPRPDSPAWQIRQRIRGLGNGFCRHLSPVSL